ncbi:MAG: tryptophan synthase subunit alpha [Pseudomonadota bacterium]
MSRIEKRFKDLEAEGRKALVTFVTAGDPDEAKSLSVIEQLAEAGADLIEIGMPFTDPMADGPAIQASSLRSLEGGMSIKGVLKMLQQFRTKDDETPVILMGYFNPIYAYGADDFVHDAKAAGADGLIIVDLPPEEDEELRIPAQHAGLDFIKLLTPTTDKTRLPKILESASGFLYYVSITGVTGTKSADIAEVGKHIQEIKTHTNLPIAIGFGIKTPDDVAAMAQIADGVVVGSAIVDNMHANENDETLPQIIESQVKALKTALS